MENICPSGMENICPSSAKKFGPVRTLASKISEFRTYPNPCVKDFRILDLPKLLRQRFQNFGLVQTLASKISEFWTYPNPCVKDFRILDLPEPLRQRFQNFGPTQTLASKISEFWTYPYSGYRNYIHPHGLQRGGDPGCQTGCKGGQNTMENMVVFLTCPQLVGTWVQHMFGNLFH